MSRDSDRREFDSPEREHLRNRASTYLKCIIAGCNRRASHKCTCQNINLVYHTNESVAKLIYSDCNADLCDAHSKWDHHSNSSISL